MLLPKKAGPEFYEGNVRNIFTSVGSFVKRAKKVFSVNNDSLKTDIPIVFAVFDFQQHNRANVFSIDGYGHI